MSVLHQKTGTKRVVVTGVGINSALGLDAARSFEGLCAGRSGAGIIRGFDIEGWPYRWGCEIRDIDSLRSRVAAKLNSAPDQLSIPSLYGLAACIEAVDSAGLDKSLDFEESNVYVGAGNGTLSPHGILQVLRDYDFSLGIEPLAKYFEIDEPRRRLEAFLQKESPCALAHWVRKIYGLKADAVTIETACAGGAQALGMGFRSIHYEKSKIALCLGADSMIGELVFAGFCKLGVMHPFIDGVDPTRTVCAFDEDRKGFVPGEGGVCIVLEELEHALKRKATIYAEVVGVGESSSAYRVTDMPSDGLGPMNAMKRAIDMAGLHPQEIGYINAHGTGTQQNDAVELLAIKKIFEFFSIGSSKKSGFKDDNKTFIGSTKPATGHLVSAAGSIEAGFAVLALYHQVVPPMINLRKPMEIPDNCVYAKNTKADVTLNYALSNSFGFGGINVSLLFRHFER